MLHQPLRPVRDLRGLEAVLVRVDRDAALPVVHGQGPAPGCVRAVRPAAPGQQPHRRRGTPVCNRGTPPSPCDGCGKTYRISALLPGGRRLCQTCWTKHPSAKKPCVRCGVVTRLFHRGMCPDCARDRSLRDVFVGPDGQVRPELHGVVDTLRALDARTVLRWVHKTPARRAAFRALATATGPVTHQTLDTVADGHVADHLRALLVAHGVLAVRDEQLAQIEQWLPKVLGRLPDAAERRIVERWARWQPLRRLHRQAAHTSPGQACGIRQEIRSVVRLLEWLPAQGSSLAACMQDHIDAYVATGPAERLRIRSFLHWTSRHQHTRALTAPFYTSSLAADIIAADTRWRLVHRLVSEPDIAVRDRAAGLLLLLFAQPPSRICALSRDDVLDDGTTLRLRLGTHPVEIPPPRTGAPPGRQGPSPRTRPEPMVVPRFPGRSADGAGQSVPQAQGARYPAPAHQERLAHGSGR